MNILIIEENSNIMKMVEERLVGDGHNVLNMEPPAAMNEAYLTRLLSVVNEEEIQFIFSIGFYPQISLACGVMGLSYISWILDITSDSYDYSVANKWNEVYVADRNLYNDLIRRGLTNIYYLPLARTINSETAEKEKMISEPQKDILIWTKLADDTTNISAVMDELYDSTKGYIDAMVEQRKSDLYSWTLYEAFPDYIRNDIEKNYPLEENSFETIAHKYDWNYFFKKFEGTYATFYLRHLLAPWNDYETLDIVGDENEEIPIEDDRVKRIPEAAIRADGYSKLDEYKAVVFLPNISNGNKLSEDMWNAMAHGAPILIPLWIDTEDIPADICYKFKNRRELDRLVRKFVTEPEKRGEYTERLRKKVLEEGTIGDRVKYILNNSQIIKEIMGGNS
ncbi:MAG: hypothetical protein E7296_08705 [Lachnospiraceae bacterium]|jgi:hypothetical protein|nr:hypothetical protein [Lachnospiraceae bacterium]